MDASLPRGWPTATGGRRQAGQALLYGLFMLVAGMAALLFLFNVGQLTQEKTKLVNTADAVAYSAGVMHARSLNFTAYTNRALVANETAVAQMISLSSWGDYMQQHATSAEQLTCGYWYSNQPWWESIVLYGGLCFALFWAKEEGVVDYANDGIQGAVRAGIRVTEVAKELLQVSQQIVYGGTVLARNSVMQQVAEANYSGDGEVQVDLVPLPYPSGFQYDIGPAGRSILSRYGTNQNANLWEMSQRAVQKDSFTPKRDWSDTASLPNPACLAMAPPRFVFNHVDRQGSTRLVDGNDWVASDVATYTRYFVNSHRFRPDTCDDSTTTLGEAGRRASDYGYRGLPDFTDLSVAAGNDEDPRVKFAGRVLRHKSQTRTSDARSEIRSTPRLNPYAGTPAHDLVTGGDVYVGLAASESFFSRPEPRSPAHVKELPNLFNPYWQTHLIEVPVDLRNAASALQGAVAP